MTRTFTVVGLIDNSSGEFLPAGVFEGALQAKDSGGATNGEDFTRYATHVEAESGDAAIAIVADTIC